MSKFKFEYQDEEESVSTSVQFQATRWDEVLDHVVKFLRGAGYAIDDNSIGVNQAKHVFAGDDYRLSNITTFYEKDEV